jgi:hypothetical protein
MAQDDKNPPKTPFGDKTFDEAMKEEPPAIHTVVTPSLDAAEQAQAEQEMRLWDAEDQSKKLEPMFVNRAYVKGEGRVLRISFGEHVGDDDVYRSAIVMTPEDAYEFGQLLIAQAGHAYGMLLEHYRRTLEGFKANDLPPDEGPNG